MSDHPAVLAHKQISEYDSDETSNIPNHGQISLFLAQLPKDKSYTWVDFEAYQTLEEQNAFLSQWEKVGLEVTFDDDRGYGGCCMIKNKSGELGLEIWMNGSSLASAPVGYVVPKT